MEDTVAAILGLLVISAGAFWASYFVGSLGCALAGLHLGPLPKTGIGLLGLLAVATLFALLQVSPPAWTLWVSAPLLVAGSVVLLRRLRRGRQDAAQMEG